MDPRVFAEGFNVPYSQERSEKHKSGTELNEREVSREVQLYASLLLRLAV